MVRTKGLRHDAGRFGQGEPLLISVPAASSSEGTDDCEQSSHGGKPRSPGRLPSTQGNRRGPDEADTPRRGVALCDRPAPSLPHVLVSPSASRCWCQPWQSASLCWCRPWQSPCSLRTRLASSRGAPTVAAGFEPVLSHRLPALTQGCHYWSSATVADAWPLTCAEHR